VLADLSIWHILILVVVVTLMFGAKRIPEMGASIGKGIQAFKRGLQDAGNAIEEPRRRPPARLTVTIDADRGRAETSERVARPK